MIGTNLSRRFTLSRSLCEVAVRAALRLYRSRLLKQVDRDRASGGFDRVISQKLDSVDFLLGI